MKEKIPCIQEEGLFFKMKLTHTHLISILDYDSNPGSGFFTWKERPANHFKPGNKTSESNCKGWNKKYAHKRAGSADKRHGYIYIIIDTKSYLAHRLAWFHYHGYMPENQIDHKDRVRHHNWILNLRDTSSQCNMRNAGMLSNNTSGVKGVYLQKGKRYAAQIKVSGETIYLGADENFDKAVMLRWKAEVLYGFPSCNTDSSSYNYLKKRGLI